jgi:hypothetical protein
VSQCIGRIRLTTTKRNEFLQSTFARLDDTDADLANLSPLLILILNDFLEEEDKHKHSARHDEQTNGELKFELF